MLHQTYPPEMLHLIPRSKWHPYPTIADREAWTALPESTSRAFIEQGESAAAAEWPVLLAERYLDYARNGNRTRYAVPRQERRNMLASLIMAECAENQGRFLDEIVNGIWLICEESSWCVPAHVGVQRAGVGLPDVTEPIVDLFAAETSVLLSWADYLLGARLDAVSPLVRPRLLDEIDARILTPCLERDDFWWMGFMPRRVNNWNPWINSNWLATALVMEPDPERRRQAVAKSMRSLDRFIDPYPKDGGCDEGPGYWGRAGASLLDCLELLWSATGGQVNVYDDPLIQDIGRFIYRVQISGDYFVNFADASAIVAPPPGVIMRYGQRIADDKMMSLGAWLAQEQDVWNIPFTRRVGMLRLLPTLFALDDVAADPSLPLPRDVWLDQIEVMVARDQEGSSRGWFVAAKGGHNAESHNHNDVGNVIVYVDGKPVIVDAGVETYTRKTFSAERYTIWTMQSAYHSLPTMDGTMQAPGREFAARDAHHEADDRQAVFSVDIAGAYPQEANVESWVRKVTLVRGEKVEIADQYKLNSRPKVLTLSLLTSCQTDISNPGQIALRPALLADGRFSGSADLHYDADLFDVDVEPIEITDERLGSVWGTRLTRLLFRVTNPPAQAGWAIILLPAS